MVIDLDKNLENEDSQMENSLIDKAEEKLMIDTSEILLNQN